MKNKEHKAEVQSLMSLGFSEYEARVYISLLRESPSTAYEISKRTGIARANAYASCESLLSKNAIELVGDRPARLIPVPPKLLLSNISERTNITCRNLESTLSDLSEGESSGFIWSLEGRASVNAKISEMIQNATESIWIKASSELLEEHRDQLKEVLTKRPDLSCVVVLFGSNPEDFRFSPNTSVFLHEGSGVRLGNADNLFTVSVDHKEALTARMGQDVQGAYTTHEPVVTMADTIIRHDIYMAEIFKEFGDQIDRKFGPHLYRLREGYFNKPQFDHFTRNLEAKK